MDERTPPVALDDTLAAGPPAEPAAGRLVAGRYRLGPVLGRGGFGTVYSARDGITGRDVALKLLDPLDDDERVRVARESAALRLLKIPGVALLLDEGRDGHDHFLVMELIEGLPFPGGPGVRRWQDLAPVSLRLLETVHRIHQAGIVHRDLKPGNVLVTAEGIPRVLDFGLARGAALGTTVTRTGAVVGTPRYLAPEQVRGEPTDARSDLYAVAAMLFEVLTGRPPHTADSVQALLQQKLHLTPPGLRSLAPDAPAHVADVLDRMLAAEPDRRPASAAVVLAVLGQDAVGGRHVLPHLGGAGPVDAAVEALLAGRAVDVVGPRGSGRTRTLEAAARRLEERGREVAWLAPGQRPFQSLAPAVDADRLADVEPSRVVEAMAELLRERLRAGLVVVADDWERVDRWSAEVVAATRGDGATARALTAPQDPDATIALQPLREAELRGLFHGPDRLLHRAEDAARALVERTGGLPSRVVAEVGAWVGSGLAAWVEGRLRVSSSALRAGPTLPPVAVGLDERELDAPLDDLLTWMTLAAPHAMQPLLRQLTGAARWELAVEVDELVRLGAARVEPDGHLRALVAARGLQRWPRARRVEAHRALAEALPAGAEGRLEHVLSAGLEAEVADEALARVAALVHEGQLADAMGVAERALVALRAVGVAGREADLLVALGRIALARQTREALEQASYQVGRRVAPDDGRVDRLARLLDAWLDVQGAHATRGAEKAATIEPFTDPVLEGWRHAARLAYAFRQGTDAVEAVLAEVRGWAAAAGDHARARYEGWLGMVRHKQSRFAEAAERQEEAARLATDATTRLTALVNAAMAHLDAFDHGAARARAEQAQAEARSLRLAFYEMHAEWLLRSVRYRLGEPMEPDLELVAAVDALGEVGQGAMLRLLEGAVAWRASRLDVAAGLVEAARATLADAGWTLQADLAEALGHVIAGRVEDSEAERLHEAARVHPWPRVGLQQIGLLRLAGWTPPDGWRAGAEEQAASVPSAARRFRLEVLSVDEALAGPG